MNFEPLYFQLFHAMAEAVTQLEAQNYGCAREILIHAQQEAEEAYLAMGDASAGQAGGE